MDVSDLGRALAHLVTLPSRPHLAGSNGGTTPVRLSDGLLKLFKGHRTLCEGSKAMADNVQDVCNTLYNKCTSWVQEWNKIYSNKKDRYTVDERYSELCDQAIRKTLSLYRGLLDVLFVHMGRLPTWDQTLYTGCKWFILAVDDKLEEYYKFQSCYLLSRVVKQDLFINELPVRPDWMDDESGYLLGGWFWRYARKCISEPIDPDRLALFYAITNVKRAGLAISEAKVRATFRKHQANMQGAEFKPNVAELNQVLGFSENFYSSEDILEVIMEKLEMLIRMIYGKKDMRYKWKVPSIKSCFEHTGAQGGTHTLFEYKEFFERCFRREFIGFAKCKTRVTPIYVPYLPDELFSECIEGFRKERDQVPEAHVHKVLEPFKCRTITAGPGYTYHLGRIVQTPLHHTMRDFHEMFKLTGRPSSLEFLTNYYNSCQIGQNGLSFFVAGDYSAATDGMHPLVSSEFCRLFGIYADIPKELLAALKRCMSGHLMHYKITDDFGRQTIEQVQQTWGQLMGSPTSFPILCIANAAVNWAAAELYEGMLSETNGEKVLREGNLIWPRRTDSDRIADRFGYSLPFSVWVEKYRPLFNGDDTCFLSNADHYKVWKGVASCAGLNPSLGKSYCHPNFIMINSEITWVNASATGEGLVFSDVFVLNPGLVKGQAKVMEDSRIEYVRDGDLDHYGQLLPMVDQLKSALNKATPDQATKVKNLFYDHLLPRLKLVRRPWQLPVAMGGLGLDLGNVNYSQRKLAAWFLADSTVNLLSHHKKVPLCTQIVTDFDNEVRDALECKEVPRYRLHKFGEYDVRDEQQVLLKEKTESAMNKYFIGGVRIEIGVDRYDQMIAEVLKIPYISPITDECLQFLKYNCTFVASLRDGYKLV